MSIHSAENTVECVAARHSIRASAMAIAKNPLGLRQTTLAKRDPNPADQTVASSTTSSNRNADKYQRILDAAVAVFAEKGFFVSRVADIADRADVADGTVYLYFKNKDEILASAINTAFDGFMKTARTELEGIPAPSDRLRRLACLHFEALGANRNMAAVSYTHLTLPTKRIV